MRIETIRGDSELADSALYQTMFRVYTTTVEKMWGTQYLSSLFFQMLSEVCICVERECVCVCVSVGVGVVVCVYASVWVCVSVCLSVCMDVENCTCTNCFYAP